MTGFDLYTPLIAPDIIEIEADKYGKTFSIQQMPVSRTRILCISIVAGESVILLGIVGAEENPKTGRRWCDRAKESIEYIGRNLVPLMFVLDKFFEMLMQV